MLKKSKFKRILALVIAVITVFVSVLVVNAAQKQDDSAASESLTDTNVTTTQTEGNDTKDPSSVTIATPTNTITTYFHETTGTLIVSGTGVVSSMYPLDIDREWPWEVPAVYDTSIKHIILDKGITGISNSFNGLTSLESISLPEGITSIYDSFMECTALESVDFPESLEEVTGFSFAECTKLKSINLKKTVSINGGYCGAPFYNCVALKEVSIPGGSTLYSAFVSCDSLENAYIGREGVCIVPSYPSDDIEEISFDSFRGCHENLKLHYVEGSLDCDADAVCWDRVYVENMPDKIALTVTATGMNINWNGRTGADVYHVYRKAKADKSWTKIADTKLTYYDDSTVKSGVEYSYLIKVDDDTDKLTSSYTRFLGTPTINSATQTKTGIKLNWSKVDGTAKYRVYRRTQYGEWVKVADVKGTTYTDNKAKSGVEYYYTVRAFGKTGYGAVDKSYPYVLYLKPPKITSVKKVTGAVRLEWESVGSQGYYLYRKEPGGNWVRIFSTYSNQTSYEDRTAKKGVQYTYTVRAFEWHRNECQRSEFTPGVNFKY